MEMIFIHIPKTGGASVTRALYGERGYGHMKAKDLVRRDIPSFTVIRNPFDRAVSVFGWRMLPGEITRKGFIDFIVAGELEKLDFMYPMVDAVMKDGQVAVDYVLRYENLAEEFEDLTGEPLNWFNKSNRDRDYRKYYNDEARAKVADIYADDIITFGYSFDPVVENIREAM